MATMVSYVESPPVPCLAGVVRTVWIQRVGATPYLQRHLPTGGVELHVPFPGRPRLLGPLTTARPEIIPPHTMILGMRFHPGGAPPLRASLDDLVDQRSDLADIWPTGLDRLVDAMSGAPSPERALAILQTHVVDVLRRSGWTGGTADPVVGEAVRRLMPWNPVSMESLATHVALSVSQLRRRCIHAVGVNPKVLQRTLRFQGFLALAQAGVTATSRLGADGVAGLAVDVGYADQAHLGRECLRLTGLTPRQLLGGAIDRCACGHDHAASYEPFLAARGREPVRA
jgi:AraC-like DNA-binding protein